MSRHAAPVSQQEHALASHLPAAIVTALVTVLLVIGALIGSVGLALTIAVVQVLVVGCWATGIAPPGLIGIAILGSASAAASDGLLVFREHDGLTPLSGVLGLLFIGLAVHQLCRSAVRVRLMESLSSAVMQCLLIVALASYLALANIAHGDRLVLAAVLASGVALLVGYAVDVVLPIPIFHEGIPRGLVAVAASSAIAALIGWVSLTGLAEVGNGGGALLGAAVGLLTALLGVSAAYITENLPQPPHKYGAMGVSCLTALIPLTLSAPVAYLFGLAITS